MSGQTPFSLRTVILLSGVMLVLAAASMLLAGHSGGDASTRDTIAADGYSHSAIGHVGFFEMLRALDRPVVRSQRDTQAKVGHNGVLVLAEPRFGLSDYLERSKLLTARNILVVLPKWLPAPDQNRRDWIGMAELMPVPMVQGLLASVLDQGSIDRSALTQDYTTATLKHRPQIDGTIQVIKDSSMTPIVATADGILLGEIKHGQQRIWVLADPDPIENHGIGVADNAAFVDDMIERLRQADGTIVFDETIHGFVGSARSPLSLLFTFPFNLAGGQALLAIALLLAAATGRFGTPQPTAPRLDAGTAGLIANAARLMEFGGYQVALLKRYTDICIADTARLLRSPHGLAGAELIAWLERAARMRGATANLSDLLFEIDHAAPSDLVRQLTIARDFYFWRKEMTNGSV